MTTQEIPEEAVQAAIAAFDDFEMRAMNAVEDQDTHLGDAMRLAITAALPHLRAREAFLRAWDTAPGPEVALEVGDALERNVRRVRP